jgi:hypothetical protein
VSTFTQEYCSEEFTPPQNGCGTLLTGAVQGLNTWAVLYDAVSDNYYLAVLDKKSTPGTLSYAYINMTFNADATSYVFFTFTCNTYSGYNGIQIQVSTDSGGSWADVGGSHLLPTYNGTLAKSVGNPLEGQAAYTGLIDRTTVRVDLTSFAGQTVLLRWAYASCKYREVTGGDATIDNVSWWQNPLTPPGSLSLSGDNSSFVANYPLLAEDPRVIGFNLYLDSGTPVNTTAFYYQFTRLTPGVHTLEVRTHDGNGHESPGVVTGSVTVTCSSTPAAPLITLNKSGGGLDITGTWTPQTAAVPATCSPVTVDSLKMRRSTSGPQGPWVEYSFSGSSTSWTDFNGVSDPAPLICYTLLSVEAGITSP